MKEHQIQIEKNLEEKIKLTKTRENFNMHKTEHDQEAV